MPMLIRTTLLALFAAVLFTSVAIAQHEEDAFVGQKAPELKKGPVWLNTQPLTLESLRGKVVLCSGSATSASATAPTPAS